MIKIFVQKNHRDLETQVNNWISSNQATILSISHSLSTLDNELVHTIIIFYKLEFNKPC